jgi:hypothetical protein
MSGVIERERALEREIKRLAWHLGEAQDEAAQMRRTAVRHAEDAASAHRQLKGAVGILRELAQMPLRASGKDYDRLVKAARDFLPEYTTGGL